MWISLLWPSLVQTVAVQCRLRVWIGGNGDAAHSRDLGGEFGWSFSTLQGNTLA